LLVLGPEGATARLIGPWVGTGELPEIARLIERAYHGELRSRFPRLAPAWSSFKTGMNPQGTASSASGRLASSSYRNGE